VRLVLALLCLAAAPVAAAPVGAVAVIDRPLVSVDSDVLWQSQLEERLASAGSGAASIDRAALINALVDDMLLLRGADEARIEVESRELDQAIDAIKQQNSIDDAQLDEALKKVPMTRAAYRLELGKQIRVFRFDAQVLRPKVVISDADIDKEIKARGLKPADADRGAIREALTLPKVAEVRAAWLAAKRKSTRIVVHAP
jgi:parvulin-like peptidyl-prolyl isomerase